MTMLSVNLNKVALLRNARLGNEPRVVSAAEVCLEAGAGGITVHPRPDQRHARPSDVEELAELLRRYPRSEFNVEGNPFPQFLSLVRAVRPTQCTLVPDAPDAITSDHGWDLSQDGPRLRPIIRDLQDLGIRVSLFVEPELSQIEMAKEIGAGRVELYTEPFARVFGTARQEFMLERYRRAAEAADRLGLGVNAGHDLNRLNLPSFCASVRPLLEVSIGHALIAYALEVGLSRAVRDYLEALDTTLQPMA